MARFSEEWLQELLNKNDVLDVIGAYVPLVRRGNNYWANCPWHHEKNPSFSVNQQKQMFYCFSCKKGGSVINFIMENEKLSYQEAVAFLAERVGMELPEEQDNQAYQKNKAYKKRLYAMMRDAALYFHGLLKTKEGEAALAYLKRRGVENQIQSFGLGYAPDRYDALKKHLEEKGYNVKEMLDAGLVRQREGHTYDVFRGRVMFPIQNAFGDVIAFGGRIMAEGEPKYLNSQETLLFNKRYHLYALNLVKKRRNLKRILLVEGYMDVVALAGAGVQTAVASLGTSLTREQAKLIKRYVDGVYLCYDGDQAGLNAALKGVDILAKEGLDVQVMVIPEGMDPDEFIKKNGVKAFYALAKQAFGATAFKLWHMKKDYDLTNPDQTVQYATKAIELLAKLENDLEKERYLRQLSKETGLSQESLQAQLSRSSGENRYNLPVKETNLIKMESSFEAQLLSLLMENPQLIQELPGLEESLFDNILYRKIFFYIDNQIKKGILPTYAEIISVFSQDGQIDLAALMEPECPKGVGKAAYARLLVRKRIQEQKREDLKRLLKAAEQAENAELRMELLKRASDLNRQIRELNTADD